MGISFHDQIVRKFLHVQCHSILHQFSQRHSFLNFLFLCAGRPGRFIMDSKSGLAVGGYAGADGHQFPGFGVELS